MKPNEDEINLIWASCENGTRLVTDDESRFVLPCTLCMRQKKARSSVDLSISTSSLLKQNVSAKSTVGSLDEISVGTTVDRSLMRPLSSAYLRKYSYLTIEDITTVNEDHSFVSDEEDYFDFFKSSASDDLFRKSQRGSISLLQLTPPATGSSASEILTRSIRGFSSSDITRRIHDSMLLSDPSTYPAFRDTAFYSTPQFCDETSISMLIPALDSSSLQDASTSTTHFVDQGTDSAASANDAPALHSHEASSVSESIQSDTLCSEDSSDFSLLDAINSLSNESAASSPNAMFSYIRESTSTANLTVSTTDASPLLTSPSFDFWVGNMAPRPGVLSLTDPRGAAAPWSRVQRRVRFAKSPERVTLSRSALSRKLDRQLQAVSLNIARAKAVERGEQADNIFLRKSFGETEFLKAEATSVEPMPHLIVKVPKKKESQSYLQRKKRRIKKSSANPVFQRLTAFQKKLATKCEGCGEVRRMAVKRGEWNPAFGRFITTSKPSMTEESPVFLRLTAPPKRKIDKPSSWNMKTVRKCFEDSPAYQRLTSVPKRQSKNNIPPLSLLIRLARKNRFKNMVEKRSSSENITKIAHSAQSS